MVSELSAATDVPQVPLRECYMTITAIILLDPFCSIFFFFHQTSDTIKTLLVCFSLPQLLMPGRGVLMSLTIFTCADGYVVLQWPLEPHQQRQDARETGRQLYVDRRKIAISVLFTLYTSSDEGRCLMCLAAEAGVMFAARQRAPVCSNV